MIIWGLDLNRIRFSDFKHSRMFDPKYYLRSQRFIAYQLAMIFTVVGESTATYTLDRYTLPAPIGIRSETDLPFSPQISRASEECRGLPAWCLVVQQRCRRRRFFHHLCWRVHRHRLRMSLFSPSVSTIDIDSGLNL